MHTASLVVAGQTIVSAVGNAASPRLAKMHAAGQRGAFLALVARMVGAGLAIGIAGTALAAVAGERILTLLFQPAYGAYADVLVTIGIGATLAYVAWSLGFALTAAQLFREQIPLLAAVCASAWITAHTLVPGRGAFGASLSFAAAMGTQAAGAAAILAFAFWRDSRRAA